MQCGHLRANQTRDRSFEGYTKIETRRQVDRCHRRLQKNFLCSQTLLTEKFTGGFRRKYEHTVRVGRYASDAKRYRSYNLATAWDGNRTPQPHSRVYPHETQSTRNSTHTGGFWPRGKVRTRLESYIAVRSRLGARNRSWRTSRHIGRYLGSWENGKATTSVLVYCQGGGAGHTGATSVHL